MKRIILLYAVFAAIIGSTALAADEQAVVSIQTGEQRSRVHELIGTPDTEAEYKETYSLENGGTAVFNYSDDIFDSGFILR